jgi:hypothetical protein
MIDQYHYEIARGIIGKLVNKFYLEKYMSRLLSDRNDAIKKAAETNQWKQFLS